jgi:hypothetical protein
MTRGSLERRALVPEVSRSSLGIGRMCRKALLDIKLRVGFHGRLVMRGVGPAPLASVPTPKTASLSQKQTSRGVQS